MNKIILSKEEWTIQEEKGKLKFIIKTISYFLKNAILFTLFSYLINAILGNEWTRSVWQFLFTGLIYLCSFLLLGVILSFSEWRMYKNLKDGKFTNKPKSLINLFVAIKGANMMSIVAAVFGTDYINVDNYNLKMYTIIFFTSTLLIGYSVKAFFSWDHIRDLLKKEWNIEC